MPNFNCSFRFLQKLLTFDTFWGIFGTHGTMWRHRWVQISKIMRFWLHHRIPHDECSLNANVLLFIPSPWEVINIWPFLVYFGSPWALWRDRWVQISKILRFWLHHRIPHEKSSVNAKFQLFIPFPWKVINIWSFLGYFVSPGDTVTLQVDPIF
jgi:hypothetical protein